jgi:hypothetical protein
MISDIALKEASKVTLGFAGAFLANIGYQLYAKVPAFKAFQKAKEAGSKEKSNRYTSDILLAADRSVGNFVEWQGIFLSLFWANAALTGEEIWLGWVYVGIRIVYPLLAHFGGITKAGAKWCKTPHPLRDCARVCCSFPICV